MRDKIVRYVLDDQRRRLETNPISSPIFNMFTHSDRPQLLLASFTYLSKSVDCFVRSAFFAGGRTNINIGPFRTLKEKMIAVRRAGVLLIGDVERNLLWLK
jgi:hypothetical protein